MMVVDTSAVMAVVLNEPDGASFNEAMITEPTLLISAGTVMELDVASWRRGGAGLNEDMADLIVGMGFIVMPVGGRSLAFAREGYRSFGIGRGEAPSALNYGDCFAYGLAKSEDAPLLFKGDDFSKTDVKVATVIH